MYKKIKHNSSDIRECSHAGTWYNSDASSLSRQLDGWLNKASDSDAECLRPARAIIAPHAGYTYCGDCASYAYRQVEPSIVRRVFILGPSHHRYLSKCALTSCLVYRTPFGNLRIDAEVYQALEATEKFETISKQTDEDEHSIEMQLPFIAKVMEDYIDHVTIVPILVGSIKLAEERCYGAILAPYLADPSTLFVISSDFCHWGHRFRYTYHDATRGHIHQSIQHLDRMGMDLIEQLDADGFYDYLKQYANTICGRHPISVLLNAIHELSNHNGHSCITLRFLKYKQSSRCKHNSDSSVSYAAASLVVRPLNSTVHRGGGDASANRRSEESTTNHASGSRR